MLYLMVGGPWHGTWKQINPDRFKERELVSIPNPLKPPIFEKAAEFGVPRGVEDASSSYYLHRFERRSLTGADTAYAYLDAVVWVGITSYRGEVMMDALSASILPYYVPAWSMP